MELPLFQVDAFTSRVFAGNPAAVCILKGWLPDAVLQAIAAENNLSETAFCVARGDEYQIRWMTPVSEVDLCGHATLASAHVILTRLQPERQEVRFTSQSGPLLVRRDGERLVMDFPSWPAEPCAAPEGLALALGRAPHQVLSARDYLAVYQSEEEIRALTPRMAELARLDRGHGVIVTAPGTRSDFVSRFFAPSLGVPEDPVTGSAHCTLTPYWARRLNRSKLHAFQVSHRGGELWCELGGERVLISGHTATYLEGTIFVPEALPAP